MTTSPPRTGTAPRSYGALWKTTPGSALYLLVVFALAMTSLSVLAALFWTGVGLLILVVGIPLIVLSLLVARGFGVADRFLLRLTGLPEIEEPRWNPARAPQGGFWRLLLQPLRVGHYWLYLLHGMIVSPIVSIVTFALTVTWISVGLGGLTYWFWGAFIPRGGEQNGVWGDNVAEALPWLFGGWSAWAVEVVLYLVAGVIFTVTMPWVLNGLSWAHHAIARGMLGPWRSDALAAEVASLDASRGAAVHAEDVGLRRLERDIHDGPQQRLVRLQLDLAALERRADAEGPDSVATLAREAREQARAALDELRALSSGVAPPLLQDRGLGAALEALAAESPLPITVEVAPGLDAALSPEVARNAYFIVAELLANAEKHSEATAATLRAWTRTDADAAPTWLDLWLVDNGQGGAQLVDGHGLEGLRDRVHGLRGVLMIESPLGGPTRIGAHIPIAASTSAPV